MNPYLAGKDAQEGSPAHALYIWIESLHERMDLFVAQFSAEDWEHDYSIASLKFLEEETLPLFATDDGTDVPGLYMEALAGYVGEVLLNEGGGRWIWDEEAGAVGMPAVQPDPVLGLEPIVPILLVGQAAYEQTQTIFATVALRLRKAVTERKAAEPGWKPERVPTPWVSFHELDECGATWKYWPNERFHDYLTWWADRAGGGRERWDFMPASLEAMEELLRDRLGTVEEYNKVAGNSFWMVAAWYVGEYVVRRKGATWQFRQSNPAAPSGTWHASDSYWTDTIHVVQRMRYAGHAEHPTEMLRDVLGGERLADVVDRFAEPEAEESDGGRTRGSREGKGERWPEVLWPLVGPEHLPPPLSEEEREQLAEELRLLEADPDLKDPDWHDNPRLNTWLAERRAAFPEWAEEAGGGADAWDFSPESLDRLEALVRARFATYEEIKGAVDEPFMLGASWYLGEVQVRHHNARWRLNPEPDEDATYDEPAVSERPRDEDEEEEDWDEDGELEEDDEGEFDDLDDEGHICLPASDLCDLIARDNPDERLREILDGYRKRRRGGDDATGGATGTTADDDEEELDGSQEVRPKWGSRAVLTLLFPPFSTPDSPTPKGGPDGPSLTPHDPVRARRIVEELGTVEGVIEELPAVSLWDAPEVEVRSDLDRVLVGCWGNVVHIVEPALGSDLLTNALTNETDRQRARYPEARIVGSVDMDYGNSYLEDVVILPGGEELVAGGWDCDDDWDIVGDPEVILNALGVDRETAAEEGFDLDDEPSERDWPSLGSIALGGETHPAADSRLKVSVFHVRRTSSARFDLEEVWFGS
ncbi:DUF6333 family protein [Streptomyces boluensis]|uniref:DUF6333 family protein n=1 Tax=Streptomyces boluensis TaxID=1775135 RepID=UPI001652362F|nr:DUF6333 family protein [Streptomyces boluensis]